jgi:hypothetical protein
MNERTYRWMTGLALFAAVCGLASVCHAQQPDRRAADAEFKLASATCKSPTDSGSVTDAIRRLAGIAKQDPNYPGLKEMQDLCQNEYKRLITNEDLQFAEAKAAYERRAYDEARAKFEALAGKNCPRAADAKSYLALIMSSGAGGGGAPAGGVSQKDYDDLETARRHFQVNNFDKARALLEPLLNKGGTIGPDAKRILDQIDARTRSMDLFQRGVRAMQQRRPKEAYDIFQQVQQQDPSYPGLSTWLTQATTELTKAGGAPASAPPGAPAPAAPAVPAPAVNADFERGKKLFDAEDYEGAKGAFLAAQAGRGAPTDLPGWIQKTELKIKEGKRLADIYRLVSAGEARLRKKDYRGANVQFSQALTLAPDDERIRALAEKARAGMKETGVELQAEDKSALLATALQQAIREFYAGNFAEIARLLKPHTGERGKYSALAYFYLGAARCTEFFLEGGSDPKKEGEARDYFRKGRQADPSFAPPADWVSPKIIEMYQRAAAER